MSQPIAEVHDSASLCDAAEHLLRHATKGQESFPDDDELTLY